MMPICIQTWHLHLWSKNLLDRTLTYSFYRPFGKTKQLGQRQILSHRFSTQIIPRPVFSQWPVIFGSRQKSSPVLKSIKISCIFLLLMKISLNDLIAHILVDFNFFGANVHLLGHNMNICSFWRKVLLF
jgi:hypothetical protein